jgi:phosphoglycolate phosphatase
MTRIPASIHSAGGVDIARPALPSSRAPVGRLVLFDLDGTLIDSTRGIWAAVRHAAERLAVPAPTHEQLVAMVGPPLDDGFRDVLGVAPEDLPAAVAAYREHYAAGALLDVSIYPGMPAVLSQMRADGHTIVVATSKPTVYAVRILEHIGLLPAFSGIYGATLDGTVSTKEQVLATALNGHPAGVRPVLIGDRAVDVLGARAHGLPCIGAAWGPSGSEELYDAGAAVVVAAPAQLPAALNRV